MCKAFHGVLERFGGNMQKTEQGLLTVAMTIAMSASVTVSIGELTTGDDSLIFLVSWLANMTYSTQKSSHTKRPTKPS